MLSTGDIKEIEWVPKELQLADCLTKSGASPTKLLSVLSGSGLFQTKKNLKKIVHKDIKICYG